MKHLLELAGFIVFTAPLAILPAGLAIRIGKLLGLLVFYLWASRRKIAVANFRRVKESGALDDPRSPEELARETFQNLGRWIAEINKSYYGAGGKLIEQIDVRGIEHYERARARGKGIIVVTGHTGNWELFALAFASKLCPILGVARKQNNPYMDRFIIRARERYGTEIVYKDGALRKFISRLKEGGTVGVIIDQSVLPEEGVLIDFLGSPAWTTRMPVALARRTGAALLPVFLRAKENGHEYVVHPEVELTGDDTRDVERLSAYVEDFIKENPTQWLWIHRRWKRVPDDEKPEGGEQ